MREATGHFRGFAAWPAMRCPKPRRMGEGKKGFSGVIIEVWQTRLILHLFGEAATESAKVDAVGWFAPPDIDIKLSIDGQVETLAV